MLCQRIPATARSGSLRRDRYRPAKGMSLFRKKSVAFSCTLVFCCKDFPVKRQRFACYVKRVESFQRFSLCAPSNTVIFVEFENFAKNLCELPCIVSLKEESGDHVGEHFTDAANI